MTTEEYNRLSILYWITQNRIKNERGHPIEFDDHRFLLDIYADDSLQLAIMKCSQVGATTMHSLKLMHSAKYHGMNQIYTLPTDSDVRFFSQSKLNKLIEQNAIIKDGLGSKSIDSIDQKEFGDAFCFIRGTWGQAKAIMLTSDRNLHDELDFSNQTVIDSYQSRQGAKPPDQYDLKYFSTPSIPNFGIHQKWLESTQQHWRFNCPHCRHRQHMDWETNVDLERRIYVCRKCHNEITPRQISRLGSWEPRYPGRTIQGYWISQLICPWVTADQLIREYEKATQTVTRETVSNFYNFKLGIPYLPKDRTIPPSLFIQNRTDELIHEHPGNVMGIDAGGGKGNHVTIGNEKGVFWIGVVKDELVAGDGDESCPYCARKKEHKIRCGCRWERCAELIRSDLFNVRTVVIDGQPYTEEAYRLAKLFRYRVYLCWFFDDPKLLEIVRFGDEKPTSGNQVKKFEDMIKVLVSRTRIMDHTIGLLTKRKMQIALPSDAAGLHSLIAHAENMFAREIQDKHGQIKREWASTGPNDFWLSFIYFVVALMKAKKNEPNR